MNLSLQIPGKARRSTYKNVSRPGTAHAATELDPVERNADAGSPADGRLDHAARLRPGGYLPLASSGSRPIAGMGDDTIANFNVPTF